MPQSIKNRRAICGGDKETREKSRRFLTPFFPLNYFVPVLFALLMLVCYRAACFAISDKRIAL
jgi:hypothetical protein